MPIFLKVKFKDDKDDSEDVLYNNGLPTVHFPGSNAIIGTKNRYPRKLPGRLVDCSQEYYVDETKYVDVAPEWINVLGFKSWKPVHRTQKFKKIWQEDPYKPGERLNEETILVDPGNWSEPGEGNADQKVTFGWWVTEDTVDQWSSPLPPVIGSIGTSINIDRPYTTTPSESNLGGEINVVADYTPEENSSPNVIDPDVVARIYGKTIGNDSTLYVTFNRKVYTFRVGDEISSNFLNELPGAKLEHNSKFKNGSSKAIITSIDLNKKRLETSMPSDGSEEIVQITYGEYLIGIKYQSTE